MYRSMGEWYLAVYIYKDYYCARTDRTYGVTVRRGNLPEDEDRIRCGGWWPGARTAAAMTVPPNIPETILPAPPWTNKEIGT